MLVVRFDADCLNLFLKQTFFVFVNCKDKKNNGKTPTKQKRFLHLYSRCYAAFDRPNEI